MYGETTNLRKIVYIFDEEKYYELKHEQATLEYYLDYLDIDSSEPNEGKRTPESECFFRAKQLRNIDSHECPIMSVRECYENLIYSIAAMYLATKKAYFKLYNNPERLTNKIDFAPITSQSIKRDTFFFIAFSGIGDVFRLSEYCQNIREIYMKGVDYYYHYSFSKDGNLLRSSITYENRKANYNYKYLRIGNEEERIRHCKETEED